MRHRLLPWAALPLVLVCAPAQAQELAGPPAPVVAEAAPMPGDPNACCTLPAGTIIELELVGPISSKTAHRGDEFPIRLAAPIMVDGKVMAPAGTLGVGQVVHAAGPSIGGKPGELILAARYLQFGDLRIPLKALKLGSAGRDNAALSLAASFVTPVAMFIPGGHVLIPAGARANAKLAIDLTLPALPPAPAPVAPPAVDSTTSPAAPAPAAISAPTQ